MEKFIAEREQKRSNIFGIPKYTSYTADMETVAAYAGTRHIDGQFLALLKRGDNVEVLPIDQATARSLKRVKVGDAVTITDTGRIKMRGRIR